MLALLIAGLAALVAAALIAVGLRGRRVGRECRCTGCGFDLTGQGVTDPRNPPEVVCPECGAAVGGGGRKRGVRVGVRKPRWATLCCGILLMVGASSIGVPLWRARAAGTNIYPFLPTRLLLWELPWAGEVDAGRIARELSVRSFAARLTPSEKRTLVAEAIDLHADTSRPFPDVLGGVIACAMEDDQLSPEQFQRYWDSLLAPTVAVRGSAPPWVGEDFTIDVEDSVRSQPWVMSTVRTPRPLILDTRVTLSDSSNESSRHKTVGIAKSPGAGPFLVGDVKAPDEPGRHEMTVEVEYRVLWDLMPKSRLTEAAAAAGLGYKKFVLPLHYTVAAGGENAPELFADPSLVPALQTLCRGLRPMLVASPGGEPSAAMLAAGYPKAPCDVAFDVFWRAGGREWKVASVATGKGLMIESPPASLIPGFNAEKVDVVFRANIAAAKLAPFPLKRVWDGEIVFKDVAPTPVRVGQPIPPPTSTGE